MSKLTVYWDQEVVGTISRHPQGKISFEYAPQWIVTKGKPISLSLPCGQKRFPPELSTAFFENLFPESENSHCEPGRYSCVDADLKVALDIIKADPGNHKLLPAMANGRLSIAGAQDKLPVYFKDDSFFPPENSGSPTTHTIKPANLNFPDIQRNESFCMELAHHIELPVPKS